MIVTCPACSARYKILEAKIPGRGAKITCPRCSHRFVFYREDAAGDGEKSTPDNVGALDFSKHGVTWRVRKGNGKPSYEFRDLNTLREYIQDGQVAQWDQISADEREWTSIDSIPNLDAFFWSYWQRLKSGEISVDARGGGEEGSEEDDSDAPTTIVGRGSSLASEIRQAVQDAATPRPVGPRGSRSDDEGGLLVEDEGSPAKTDSPSPVRKVRPTGDPPDRTYSAPPFAQPSEDGEDFVASGPPSIPPGDDPDLADPADSDPDLADPSDDAPDERELAAASMNPPPVKPSPVNPSPVNPSPVKPPVVVPVAAVAPTAAVAPQTAPNAAPPVEPARPVAPPKPVAAPAAPVSAPAGGGIPMAPLVLVGGFVVVLVIGVALYAAGVVG